MEDFYVFKLLSPISKAKIFKPKARALLGLDFCLSSIKLLQMSYVNGSLCVDGYTFCELPAGAFEKGLIQEVDVVSSSLKKLCNASFVTTNQVALAVPDASVFSQTVQLSEGLTDKELEESVFIETVKHSPFPIGELFFDFVVQSQSATGFAMQDVLVVACSAELIKNRMEVLAKAGLEACIVDVESFVRTRATLDRMSEMLGTQGTGFLQALGLALRVKD